MIRCGWETDMAGFKLRRISLGDAFGDKKTKEVSEDPSAGTRNSVDMDPSSCTMCGDCEERCPAAAIRVYADEHMWEINRMQCILCGICEDVCPENCIKMSSVTIAPDTVMIADVFSGENTEETE